MASKIQNSHILSQIKSVAYTIREEMVGLYGPFLGGKCIEASDKIVAALSEHLSINAKTVEGWCRFDDEYYGSDRPWDPHTWVEVPSLGLYIDVTADQFNYGMYSENEFPGVIVQKGLPHGMQYNEPSWDEIEMDSEDLGLAESSDDKPSLMEQIISASSQITYQKETHKQNILSRSR